MDRSTSPANGILNLYKPAGLTSMEAVRRVRRLTGQRGVGHGGTLDPLAEGVLPICFGQATRLMEYLVEKPKLYRMGIRLGITTDTFDAEGKVVRTGDPSGVTEERVEEGLRAFRGTFYQTPPMYSALKREGRRLYELARVGVEVERQPRRVEVMRLELLELNLPDLILEVECGRGIYIRSLAHDLGEALGCGGHLVSLVRLRAGPFLLEGAISLEGLGEGCREGTWRELLHPLDFVLLPLKAVTVSRSAERRIRNGQPVDLGPRSHYASHMESYRVYNGQGCFLGVVCLDKPRGLWRPYKVFCLENPSPYAPRVENRGFPLFSPSSSD